MRRVTIPLISLFITALSALGAEPTDYYKTCEGKHGKSLLQALQDVIDNHIDVSYKGLWTLYAKSDIRDNGTIWDMYSTKEWTVSKEQCGQYGTLGDCYNREHSFPKSWFNDDSPMVSDAFHIYPTDGKVNSQRNNYPYGECANGTTLSPNGKVKALGKLGTSTFPGYSGTVFEPVDEYKGDFARSYFYMAARYNDLIAGWKSDMLARNNYPVFSPWALNLLLKWHRQDPVSDKETRRNDVVFDSQKNRNPFIDHPELVEYIWGDKKDQGWIPGGETTPRLTLPADGTTINVGTTGLGVERSVTIPVRGTSLVDNIAVTVSGMGFSCNTTSIPYQQVNRGHATISVSYINNTVTTSTGTLSLTSGNTAVTVNLQARSIDTIEATDATEITETSFTANWCNIHGDGAMYSLMLYLNGSPLTDYPIRVPAEDESYTLTGLQPDSDYSYTLSYNNEVSNTVNVRTATPIPSIQFLFDGELDFVSEPGVASDIAEILMEVENIAGNINLSVNAPFELSTDKSSWNRTITLTEDEDRFYMRLNGSEAGRYTSYISATAGDYIYDDIDVTGIITSAASLLEDFESGNSAPAYTNGTYKGNATEWNITNVAIDPRDKSKAYSGNWVCCFGNNSNSSISTSEPLQGGIGTVSFMAKLWSKDAHAKIKVQYSTDGNNWIDAGSVIVESDSEYSNYSATVNHSGALYLRLQQVSGKRVLIDDIEASRYSGVGAVTQLYYHSWDAYTRDGLLIIENSRDGDRFSVYSIDGTTRFEGDLPSGETALKLESGLYIITSGNFARRVLIK